jgi:hypothetical protein
MGKSINALTDNLTEVVNKAIKVIITDLMLNLPQETPVDTGWAKANWQVGFTPPLSQLTVERDIKSDLVSGAESAQSKTLAFALAYTPLIEKAYVYNRVDYISELNKGTSPKAPPGFVEAAIAQALRK